MISKGFSLNNYSNQKIKENSEEKHFPKKISTLKKKGPYNKYLDIFKNKNIFKKESEIQNNSIIEEDDYNEDIYNNSITSYKYGVSEEKDNEDYKSKSSFSSFDEKNKNIFLFYNSKIGNNKDKNSRYSMESNVESNHTCQDSSIFSNKNSISDKDNLYFMNIITIFNNIHKKLENIINCKRITDNKNRNYNENKETSKYSIKNRQKIMAKNNNYIGSHYKSPSNPLKENNRKKNIYHKINENNNKIACTDTKIIINSKDGRKDLIKDINNNINLIKKNLFKNYQQSISCDNKDNKKNKEDIKKKNPLILIGLNKKIISERSNKINKTQGNVNNNNQIFKNINSKLKININSNIMGDGNSFLNENYSIKKQKEKRRNSPLGEHKIIKKKLILEDDLKENEKMKFSKKIEINNNKHSNSLIYQNYNNKEKNDNDINKNYFKFKSINIKDYQKNNKNTNNNKNINDNINNSNNKRYLTNNSFASTNKEDKKKINIFKPINDSKTPNEKNSDRFLKSNKFQSINLEKPKTSENFKIKIDKPLSYSPSIIGNYILNKSFNNNPFVNSHQNQNLKNSSNEIKIKKEKGEKKNFDNCRSNIFKKEKKGFFKNDYYSNYNQIILSSNFKQNINFTKAPISSNTSIRNIEKKRNFNIKNDEINRGNQVKSKSLIVNKNEREKINLNRRNNNIHKSVNMTNKDIRNISRKNINNKINNSINNSNNNSINNSFNNIHNNKNNTKIINNIEDNKIYINELRHQNNFQRNNYNKHLIKSTSSDKNMESNIINNEPFCIKVKKKFPKIITSSSMDNIRFSRKNKLNEIICNDKLNENIGY